MTTGRRIDVVLVKLCAVVILVMSLQSLTDYAGFFTNSGESYLILIGALLLNFGIPVLIAAAIWFFPATVIGGSVDHSDTLPATEDFALMAVTLVGLYTIVFGVVDLSYYESIRFLEGKMADPNDYGTYSPSPSIVAGRFSCIVQILVGLALLVGKRSIVRLMKGARKAGADAS